jgi:hypothetical protein
VGCDVEIQLTQQASFDVEVLERLRPRWEHAQALVFPGSVPVDPQQELTLAPVIGVRPRSGDPWIGVFSGAGYPNPLKPAQLLSGPDDSSLCVVFAGAAYMVKSNEPTSWVEVDDPFPIRGALVAPEHEMILFHSFDSVVAYGLDGMFWRTSRLVWDDLELVGCKGDTLHASGFDAPWNRICEFTIDLRSGAAVGHPYSSS